MEPSANVAEQEGEVEYFLEDGREIEGGGQETANLEEEDLPDPSAMSAGFKRSRGRKPVRALTAAKLMITWVYSLWKRHKVSAFHGGVWCDLMARTWCSR